MSDTATAPAQAVKPPSAPKPVKAPTKPIQTPAQQMPAPEPVVETEPQPSLPPLADGTQTIYGGRPAYVGAIVWFCRKSQFDPLKLVVQPAMLHERRILNSRQWTLNVFSHPGAPPRVQRDVEFSETPQDCCWTWPIIPLG